jgi:hypothetical protein
MNPILEVKDEWIEILTDTRLKSDADAEDLILLVAGSQTFAIGPLPQTQQDIEKMIEAAGDELDEIIRPALSNQASYESTRRALLTVLTDSLNETVEPKTEADICRWADEFRYLLRDYPSLFAHEAALALSWRAVFHENPHIPNGVVAPLVDNLSSDQLMTQRSSARALADIAAVEPQRVAALFESIINQIHEHDSLRDELLVALLEIIEAINSGMDICISLDRLREVAQSRLHDDEARVRTLAVQILNTIAHVDVEIVLPAAPAVQERYHDPHPAVADFAEEIINRLDEEGLLSENKKKQSEVSAPTIQPSHLEPAAHTISAQISTQGQFSDYGLPAENTDGPFAHTLPKMDPGQHSDTPSTESDSDHKESHDKTTDNGGYYWEFPVTVTQAHSINYTPTE